MVVCDRLLLLVLASNERRRWEKSVNDEEFEAISKHMSSLPLYERWKRLSPLTLRLKSAFLSCLLEATGDAVPGETVVDGVHRVPLDTVAYEAL